MALYNDQAGAFTDPSRFFSDLWCAYLRERGHKPNDQQAKELRWMAHEWRRRALKPMPEVREQWDNTILAVAIPEARPMREVPIKTHTNRRSTRAEKYTDLPNVYGSGESFAAMATRYGVCEKAVRKAVDRRVREGSMEKRG